MRENFFLCFFSLARLSLDIEDKFLRLKLIKKVGSFFDAFIDFELEKEESGCVAQCKDKILKIIDELFELIDLFTHIETVNRSPALLVQKNLLSFKSKILDFQTLMETSVESEEKPKLLKNKIPKTNNANIIKQKITSFVQTNGDSSAKEIISVLSREFTKRTIQRHLSKLLETGELNRRGKRNNPKYHLTTTPS